MTRHGLRRWPLWRRVHCADCRSPLVPDVMPDLGGHVRGYMCRCGLRRDAGVLERRVLAACRAAETARTGGRVRPYVIAAARGRRTAADFAGLTALVWSSACTAIEVLQLPTVVHPGPAEALTVPRRTFATRPITRRQQPDALPSPKGTPCRSASLRTPARTWHDQ
ncbi:hypothetical protein [Dactylosporangium sp. CA-233914]|uniref:hypothetical protein n=1 Tax=Dactylosporangium sp. CA-233914 TaxID=3239934 RepID=UPI003D8DE312